VETFGAAARRLRGALSLREVARRAHIDPGHLSRLEADKRPPTPTIAAALDEVLGAAGQLAALVPDRRAEPWRLDGGLWRLRDSERLAAAIMDEEPTADNAVELAHQWLITEPPQVYEIRSGRRIGVAAVEQIERRVQRLRLLDDHVGGNETYAMVTGELAATSALLRDAAYTEEVGRRLLVAVGELCQLAGWTSSDAGRHAEAERLYLAGVRAAHAGGDVAGAANNLSSLAYQVANVGDPREAATLARSAYAGARGDATATTRALLAERVAWAAARAGEASGAERALATVETEYERRRPADDPEWVYWLDEGEIEIMAGRVWTQLRRPLRAVPILERATAGYGDDTGRETALYLTWLAESLLQANEVERAADAATRALRLSRRAGSARADDRVAAVRTLLERHRGNASVDAFEDEACA
jgi:transcriptional regulator with XRE-family HTH domain